MNTLHHLGAVQQTVPALSTIALDRLDPTARPSMLDRAAMRVGLWLLLWGRHRAEHRVDRDAYARHLLAEQVRRERERADAYAAFSLPQR